MTAVDIEGLLRDLAPRVLGVVARRWGDLADAEDAVQEALVAAAQRWPEEGRPDNPLGWLVRVASRRMIDGYRSGEARRRREELAAAWSLQPSDAVPDRDDTLTLLFLCCHPSLTPATAIPLALRAVGGLTTREIAAAFLVPETTMAQRISRAKATLRELEQPFALPPPDELGGRLASVLHILYLVFNEGYATSVGPDLGRADLAREAIRLTRVVRAALPEDAEVTGLLALMLLTEARRPARTTPDGDLVPLEEQDRRLWDQRLIAEGVALLDAASSGRGLGEYGLSAAIAATHDVAVRAEETDWRRIVELYTRLDEVTDNPMVTLNRAVAVAMVEGPAAGLDLLAGFEDRLGDHHRLHAVRAHLHERGGDTATAIEGFRAAAARTDSARERNYLTTKAARLAASWRAG